jgi:hypothetical protein
VPSETRPVPQPSLVGFDEAEASRFCARTGQLAVEVGSPEVRTHSNATVPPLIELPPGPEPGTHFFGGVYDEAGRIIPESRLWRGDRCYVDASPEFSVEPAGYSEEHVAYAGVHFGHFGHMVTEGLARLWYCVDADRALRVAVQTTTQKLSPVARQLYEWAGLSGRVMPIQSTTRFRRVTVVAPAFVMHARAHTAFKSLCVWLADRALRGARRDVSEQPLYLSRSRLPATRRVVFGEPLFEKLLLDSGVKVVHTQELDLPTQIQLVNSHRFILGPLGSAFHLLLFSRLPNRTLYLAEDAPPASYLLCDALNGTEATYLKSTGTTAPPLLSNELDRTYLPQLLDLERVTAALRDIGIVAQAVFDPEAWSLLVHRYRREFVLRALLQTRQRRLASTLALADQRVNREFPDDLELREALALARQACAGID